MIYRFFKIAAIAALALSAIQAQAKDTYIKRQVNLSNGASYELNLTITDQGRANILPYGFKMGVIGKIKLSSEEDKLQSTEKFLRLYTLAREAASSLKQKPQIPVAIVIGRSRTFSMMVL